MKIKTAGLIDTALDWAVTECNYVTCYFDHKGRLMEERGDLSWVYAPSTDWSQGGPIIEREELSVEPLYTSGGLDCWQAYGHNLRYDDHGNYINGSDNRRYGPTPLIAAMRCYVASKLGDEVDVPEELCHG